jgi:hypothetical protein
MRVQGEPADLGVQPLTDTVSPAVARPREAPEPAGRPRRRPAPRPDHRRARTGTRLLAWALLLAGLVATIGWLLWPRFFYGNDDLLQFSAAREDGLTWEYLSLNVFQHFGPYNRFGHWLVYEYTDLSPALGLTLVLANCTAMLAAALWLMTELRLSAPRRIAALIAIALSVPVAESAIWFDAGMHILPAIAVTLVVCAAHVRGIRTGRWRWHAVATLVFVLGQLIQERPWLALPLVVLVDVLLLWRELPWRTRLRRLWGLRLPLAALTLCAAAIAFALQAYVVVDTYATPSWAVTGRHMLMALTDYVVPSLVNQPLRGPSPFTVQLAVLGGILAVGVLLAWSRKYNSGPLLFAACSFLLYYGFLKFSPLLTADLIGENARRLQYAVYATVPAIIGLAHVRLPRVRRRPAQDDRPISARWPFMAFHAAGCLALAGYLLVTDIGYLDRQWDQTTQARAYMDTVRAHADEWSDPGVDVLPLFAPSAMATAWSTQLARHDVLLPFIAKDVAPGDVGRRTVLIDDRGAVRPAALATVLSELDLADGGCGSSPPPRARFTDHAVLYFPPVVEEPLFLRLRYQATEDVDIQLSSSWNSVWTANSWPTRLAAGSHTRLIPIGAPYLMAIDLQAVTPGAVFCVADTSIVRPLEVDARTGRCREVDWFGRAGRRTDCS